MTLRITSPWKRIIEYPDNHLNDFCLFRALDGQWHCIGIMGTGTWESETSLFHCSSPFLYGPYDIHNPLLADLGNGATANHAPQKHAPFVVIRDDTYHLFFRRPLGTNLLLMSSDLFTWPREPEVMFEESDARDACIQEFGGNYYWYYCQWRLIEDTGRSCIRLRRSKDLRTWGEPIDVHVDTSREVRHSHLQSPFVVQAGGRYWLFVRDRSQDADCATTVFASDTPNSFPSGNKAWTCRLTGVHAPEIVKEQDHCYLARVSGVGLPLSPPRGGWIDLAEISFRDDNRDSQQPNPGDSQPARARVSNV